MREFREILLGRTIIVRTAALQIHRVRTPGVVARAVERRHEIGQAFVEDGLGYAFVAAEPYRDRRMIAVPADDIAGIGEEQRRILRFHLKILRRNPEIVEYQQSVFIRQIVKHIFGILTEPIADDVQVGIAMQLEVRFESLTRDSLARIVHAPASAACGDRHAVHAYDEIRAQNFAADGPDGPRILAGGCQALRPALRRALDGLVTDIDQALAMQGSECRIDLDASQSTIVVEQRQFIGQLANTEVNRGRIRHRAVTAHVDMQGVQARRTIAIGPPQARRG